VLRCRSAPSKRLNLPLWTIRKLQDVDRAVSDVVGFHLLDRQVARRIGPALQNWQLGISSALRTQIVRSQAAQRAVAPETSLPILNRGRASGSLVTAYDGVGGSHLIEYPLNRPGTDRYYDHAVKDWRSGRHGPGGCYAIPWPGFQAGQIDDLSALEGGKSWPGAPNFLPAVSE